LTKICRSPLGSRLIECTNDGERHSRRFTDASLPDDVRSLIAWVDSRPERRFS